MKPIGPNFGFVDIEYGLSKIFYRSVSEFHRVDNEVRKLESEYSRGGSEPSLIEKILEACDRRREAGSMLLISASSYLEQRLYAYAVTYLDPESYEKHLGRSSLLSRWILTPRICAGIIIDESNSAINALNELISARNSIVHPKRQVMFDIHSSDQRVKKEMRRFLQVCGKAQNTVANALSLLKSPESLQGGTSNAITPPTS